MQSACGGREGAAGAGVDAGGKKVDRWILVFVGAAGVVCAESGGRRSGQAGYGGGRGQIEVGGRGGGWGGGGGLLGGGGGTFWGGVEGRGGNGGGRWVVGGEGVN